VTARAPTRCLASSVWRRAIYMLPAHAGPVRLRRQVVTAAIATETTSHTMLETTTAGKSSTTPCTIHSTEETADAAHAVTLTPDRSVARTAATSWGTLDMAALATSAIEATVAVAVTAAASATPCCYDRPHSYSASSDAGSLPQRSPRVSGHSGSPSDKDLDRLRDEHRPGGQHQQVGKRSVGEGCQRVGHLREGACWDASVS
jgi:hypothetical protein